MIVNVCYTIGYMSFVLFRWIEGRMVCGEGVCVATNVCACVYACVRMSDFVVICTLFTLPSLANSCVYVDPVGREDAGSCCPLS